jgi:transcriptional regulator with XRE-family HTH domain
VHSDEYKLLAEHLRLARVRSGLTQREVAARLRKPPAFPHKVEHGERELNVVELLDYCEALGIDFVQFAAEIAQAVRELRGVVPTAAPAKTAFLPTSSVEP